MKESYIMMGVKFIYFDVGYTLVDEERVWAARCREQASTAEARALGLSADDIFGEIVNASRSYLPQYRTVVKRFGFTEVAPYRHELERLYPQAREVLERLSAEYRLGVIANQTDGLRKRLADFGIERYFSEIISSWDYGVMKPDLELFRIGIERSGVSPDEVVMVGDRLDNDIFPANSVGMRTVWVKQGFGGIQTPRSMEYEPTATVESIGKILEII